ncbi:hypothetical protein [Paracoccus aestuariivivens]|uniref:Uncharacterized protein n=1 Tax=Paracoccus aestuariivivens TaxID=1820333 RepID=A0A6L6JBM9_9RHOB|nr:hypothetical protein [Paracoccus aestuariivivens]MTH77564.1 hypothetical protein [Paracoccus aestuariivivens]
MTFDFDAALAEILTDAPATIATFATNDNDQQLTPATPPRPRCDTAGRKEPCRNDVAAVSQAKALNNKECLNVANVAGQVLPVPPRIAAAIHAAFEDYAATNDSFDARAWA